jgi:predicted glutamine amidotransferase
MCELFAMSAGQNYTAQAYLPRFADKARASISGWGLGWFRNGQTITEKSLEKVYAGDQLHDSFQRLARVIDSRIILCHIHCERSEHRKESQAQPLTDHFLGHHWLFCFTGESAKLAAYQSPRPLVSEEILAARVLEFVRDRLEAQMLADPCQDLYQSLALAGKKLITDFPGQYTFLLANETVLFAFLNHGQLLTCQDPAGGSDSLMVTTIPGGLTLDPAHWCAHPNPDPSRGRILIISGSDLLYLGHL